MVKYACWISGSVSFDLNWKLTFKEHFCHLISLIILAELEHSSSCLFEDKGVQVKSFSST